MRLPLALFTFLTPFVAAGVHEVWWNITYVQNANPDGLFARRVIGVNDTWPPPPIEVSTADSLVVHAFNGLDTPTTLHHHGMFFNSSSWYDGAMGVTQCGIPPGQSMDYHIPTDTSGQWGSYWVHAHASGQYVDGLRAPVIIHPPKEVHQYDDDFTVVLGDWYHQEHAELLKGFVSLSNPRGAEPIPDSALIYFTKNGQYLGPIAGTHPSSSTAAVGFNENATLPFVPGKTYRLRVINTSAFATFYFWIDGHQMRIIEADGTDVEEKPYGLLSVTAAQRYSVLVTARNDTQANWAIHANMDTDMFDKVPPALNPNVTSSITYSPGASISNLGTVDEYKMVEDIALVPSQVVAQLPPSTKSIELEFRFVTTTDGTNRAMFNSVTWNMPKVPALFSELSLGPNATSEKAYGPNSVVLEHQQVFDIVLKNADTGKHPFHLHGHKVQMIDRSDNYTDPSQATALREGQTNPMRRDVIQVPGGASVTLRVVADNPGVWLFHCHIEWHLEVGLAYQFIEAPLVAQQRDQVPQTLYDQCRTLDKPFTGNAAGHASADDLSGLVEGPYLQKLGWRPKGIGAMFACVFSACLGMGTVVWYALGERVSEEEIEREARAKIAAKKARRGKMLGVFRPKKN